MIKNIFYIVLSVLVFACPVTADDLQEVETLIKVNTDKILSILHQKDTKETDKQHQIMEVIEPLIDFQLMAKLTLGKTNWGKMDKKQQSEFVDLFVERLKRSYLDKTSFYNDEKVIYKPGVQKGNKVYVPVEIITSDKPIELLYKFYRSKQKQAWMAYDLEINGVSLIKSYHAQFSEILKTGGSEKLLEELKKTAETIKN